MDLKIKNISGTQKDFKNTDIGAIPKDWTISLLEPLTSKIGSGITPRGGSKIYLQTGRAFVRSQNVGNGNLRLDDLVFIDDTTHSTFPNTEIKVGDVFLNISGASIGRSAIANKKVKFGNVNQHVCIIRPLPQTIVSKYLNAVLLSEIGQRQIDSYQSGGNREGLNIGQIRTLKIPVPEKYEEQKAIATVLTDTDNYINTLKTLIAKKKAIKQGAMQELLTGKKRLKGFTDKWNLMPLSDLSWFQEGPGVRKSQFTDKGVKLLNGTNIEKGKLLLEKTSRFISEKEAFGWYSHFLIDEEDILIACSGVTIDKFHEKVTIAKKRNLPLCMNTSTMRFKIKSGKLNRNFLFHFLKSNFFKDQIGNQATGSAQLNFGPSHVSKIKISIPSVMEQKAIALILKDVDAEIEALEIQLQKTQNLKQGMMQELLTGKIRLRNISEYEIEDTLPLAAEPNETYTKETNTN